MRKAFVFDFDDTLATTDCRVIVCGPDGEGRDYLTPSQFNVHQLDDDEYYDFSEFRDENFIHQADPTFLIHLAKEVYDEGHQVYVLTARSSEVAEAIQVFLAKFGIGSQDVHCVTNRFERTKKTIAEKKADVLLDIVSCHDKIYFYDDSEENVNVFTHEKLRAYKV